MARLTCGPNSKYVPVFIGTVDFDETSQTQEMRAALGHEPTTCLPRKKQAVQESHSHYPRSDPHERVYKVEGARSRGNQEREKKSGGIDGGVGQGYEERGRRDPAAVDAGGAEGRRGVAAAAQGGVPRAHRIHVGEQVQGQRLVPHLRRQPGGHPLGGHLLVRPQPPSLRVPPPVRHPRRLPPGRPRDRAPHPRRQDTQDVPGRENLPHRALQASVGEELPKVRDRARTVPRARAVARGGGADSGRFGHGEAQG